MSAPTDIAYLKSSKTLVYLLHGITGTPMEMGYLAVKLARQGWDVMAPTLPGHAQSVRALVRTHEDQWREFVTGQLRDARTRYDHVFAAGLSAGGSLVLDAAAEVELDGIGVLSPTFTYDGWNAPWTDKILPFCMRAVPNRLQHLLFHVDGPPYGLKDPALQAKVRAAYSRRAMWKEWLGTWWARWAAKESPDGYPIFPLKTLTEVDRLNRRVLSRLQNVHAPALILQAIDDDMTGPGNAERVYKGIGSAIKKVVQLDDCYHVITADRQRRLVADEMIHFFRSRIPTQKPIPS